MVWMVCSHKDGGIINKVDGYQQSHADDEGTSKHSGALGVIAMYAWSSLVLCVVKN